MKITEYRAKSGMLGETHLKQMIKLNAHSGLTLLIYVKRCIKFLLANHFHIQFIFLYVIRTTISLYCRGPGGAHSEMYKEKYARAGGVYGDH